MITIFAQFVYQSFVIPAQQRESIVVRPYVIVDSRSWSGMTIGESIDRKITLCYVEIKEQ